MARRDYFFPVAIFLFTFAVGLIVLVLFTGCAGRGTITKRAEAFDFRATAPAGRGSPASPREVDAPTGAVHTFWRWRLTDSTNPPPSAGQRFARIVGTAGGVAAVILVALIILAPSTVAAFALKRWFAFRRAFSETVAGLHHAQTVSRDPVTHDALKAAQSPATRALVEDARRDA